MIVLSCNNICKTYVVDEVLKNISFTIRNGEKIGLIGLNGSGKTSLFNILTEEIERDSGSLFVKKGLKIGYLKQHTNMASDKTIFNEALQIFNPLVNMEKTLRSLENKISTEATKGESKQLNQLMDNYSKLLEEFNKKNGYGYKSEIRGVLKGLGFCDQDMDKKVNVLSGGQKARLYLAKLLLEKPDLLLLDEPTNHLDIEAINWLESYITEYQGAVLVISHDRYFLDNIVCKIFYLQDSQLQIYNANYSMFMEKRKKELELLKKQFFDQQKEIKRLEEIIQRFSNYGDRRYIRQAQSRQKMLDKIKLIGRPKNNEKINISFEPKIKSGRDVLNVENIGKSFNNLKLLKNINFNIYRGEKVGLIGPNGIGKTTLFKIILGQLSYDEGNVILGQNVHMEHFDQEQNKLNLNKTVVDEIWDDNPSLNHYQIRSILSKFLFIGDDIFQEIENLSGGERGRLSLLKMMLSDANLLLMDEPTNHLDIDSKEVLEDALIDYHGTLFVISHDRYFLNKVVDKIFELTVEGINEYLGNYNYYLKKKNELIVEEEEGYKSKTQIQLEKRKERKKLKLEQKKRENILQVEDLIEKKESQLKELDQLLCNPQLYGEPDKILDLSKKRDETQLKLDSLYERWIILTES